MSKGVEKIFEKTTKKNFITVNTTDDTPIDSASSSVSELPHYGILRTDRSLI